MVYILAHYVEEVYVMRLGQVSDDAERLSMSWSEAMPLMHIAAWILGGC